MDPLVPLADDPLPPPSPSYTHSSASSTSRSHRRPADLHSLSSRESDWSSSDAEHISEGDADDNDEDEAFDVVSSAELPPPAAFAHGPPPLAPASIRSLGTATSSNDGASESAASADESDSPEHMKLSFPDPLNASASSAASDGPAHSGGERLGRTALDDSILLDGEGAYSLLLDARPAPSSSSASSCAEPDSASGLTSPLLRAQDEPRVAGGSDDEDEQRMRAIEGGVGEWVRRTRLSAKKREQGMRERGVQTVRSVEGDGDEVKLELGSSVVSSMAGSSLVSSQATVVPAAPVTATAAPEIVEALEQIQAAIEPLPPAVEVGNAAMPRPVRPDSSHALVQRRRTLLAVALASALALSASIWLGPSQAGHGVEVVTRAGEQAGARVGTQAVRPDVGLGRPPAANVVASAGWLEGILPVSSGVGSSSSASAVGPAAASPSSLDRKPSLVAEVAIPSSPAEPGSTAPAPPAHVHSRARPCAACALATLPAALPHAVVPFAPAVRAPTATAVTHGKRSGHARPRRARVELGHGPGVELEAGVGEEKERVSLFREPVGGADSLADGLEPQQPVALANALQSRVRNLVAERLARAQRALPPASRVYSVADRAGRLARSAGSLVSQSTHAGLAALVERARRASQRAHVRKGVRALGSSSGARARHEVERLVRSARRAPESTHEAIGNILSRSRHVGRVTKPGRRAFVEAALAAQLPQRARRALRRIEASVPSRRQLKHAASSRLINLDLRADLDLVIARIRSYAASSVARASSARVAVDVASKRCSDVAQAGAEESRRHVRRAAKTARRLTKQAERRVGRRERHA